MITLNLVFFVVTTLIVGGALLALQTAKYFAVRSQLDDDKSRTISFAGSASVFVPHFDRYVSDKSVIYLPSGDGGYMTRFKKNRNLRYQKDLAKWLDRGATIHIIITCGTEESVGSIWRPLKEMFPEKLHVHFLDRSMAVGENAGDTKLAIERLDTFHSVILLNEQGSRWYPGAMWLETNHPIGSKFAEGIIFVKPADALKDIRLLKYKHLYERLLCGPHATELQLAPANAPAARAA